jgi:hypothetical protein
MRPTRGGLPVGPAVAWRQDCYPGGAAGQDPALTHRPSDAPVSTALEPGPEVWKLAVSGSAIETLRRETTFARRIDNQHHVCGVLG